MHLRHALTTALLALCCADSVVGRQAFVRRQESVTPAPTDGSATTPSSTASSTETTNGTSSLETTDKQGSQSTPTTDNTTAEQTDTSATSTKTNGAASSPTKDASKKEEKEDPLPIKPRITPAAGIAGVILMISGAAYAIIGIKHQWLVVFFSAAYLVALAVAVLVVYVMDPPISDAIQGAYMVASVVTGLMFGAISLIFKEVTEGLGCLLGGFCMAMWFLVLKPGGLITDTTGKAIMIGVLSAVAWSLSFSQHTRSYGLIVCTSFSGAMIAVLGIDCFSRAGLKEFWMYLWDLNDDAFPLHTNTYPINRGIRVEIAATIILFMFGLMSQFKIWKIVKERRTKKEAQRLADDERREQRDSKIGKKVENKNRRSLAQWEAVYGNKDSAPLHTDSGVGTSVGSAKGSTSVTEREVDSIEMDHMGYASKGPRTSISRVDSGGEAQRVPELQLDLENGDNSWWADYKSSKSARTKSKRGSTSSIDYASLNGSSSRPPLPGVPSQFATPMEQDEDERALHERRGVGLGGMTLNDLDPQEPGSVPRFDDDRASSIAATLNDEIDMDDEDLKRLSVAPSSYQLDLNQGRLSPFADEFAEKSPRGSAPQTPDERPANEEEDDEELVRPATAAGEPAQKISKRASRKSVRKSTTKPRRKSTGSAASGQGDEADESEGDVSVVQSLKAERLPESMSKLAMAYRTNEWAKHSAEADQPVVDEAPGAEEPGVQVEIELPEEPVRTLVPDAMIEKAPMDASGKLYKKRATKNPYRSSQEPQPPLQKRTSSSGTPVYAFQRSSSHQPIARQNSSNSLSQQKRDAGYSSIPMSPPLVESPMEDQPGSTPYLSTTNLLDERSNRMSTRPTTTSFNALTSPPNVNLISPSPTPDDQSSEDTPSQLPTPSSEDIPLAHRASLIKQGAIRPSTSHPDHRRSSHQRQSSNPSPAPGAVLSRMPSVNGYAPIYDSHQPRRSNTADANKQKDMLNQWRTSLQYGNSNNNPATMAEEQARMAMLQQRQSRGYKEQKQQDKKAARESMIDVAMRTGQLTSKHQEAMRRMQAKVGEGAKPGASS